jgi:hypothetical protein
VVLSAAHGLTLPVEDKTVDPAAFLKVRKTRKFMGTQDDLAVVTVGRALAMAQLKIGASGDASGAGNTSAAALPGDRVGLYAAIGFIPFERSDIAPVLAGSLTHGLFDIRRFSEEGYGRAHPLLTFRCLPNMPAYHVSANFGITGPYMVTYPGEGQAFLALEEAVEALSSHAVDAAVVFATAHQRNFLVQHHYARLDHPVPADLLRDAACALVLEREDSALARGVSPLARLTAVDVEYLAQDPLAGEPARQSTATPPGDDDLLERGSAGPFMELSLRLNALPLLQERRTRDGLVARAVWNKWERHV